MKVKISDIKQKFPFFLICIGLVALLLCPFAAPMLLSLAGSALIVTAAALFAWLF